MKAWQPEGTLSDEAVIMLAYLNGRGAELVDQLQQAKDAEIQRVQHLHSLKKGVALCFLMGFSAAVITTVWLDHAVDWWHHWALWAAYVWSASTCWEILKKPSGILMTLDEWEIEVRYQIQECRAYQQRHEGARQRIHPATWAQQTATAYVFINLTAHGLADAIDAMARVAEAPCLLLVNPERLAHYLDRITNLDVRIPAGCGLYTYDNILSTPAPVRPGLLIVENANELLANLAKRNKSVNDFYQWSVGYYPIPNRHTHLILQPH